MIFKSKGLSRLVFLSTFLDCQVWVWSSPHLKQFWLSKTHRMEGSRLTHTHTKNKTETSCWLSLEKQPKDENGPPDSSTAQIQKEIQDKVSKAQRKNLLVQKRRIAEDQTGKSFTWGSETVSPRRITHTETFSFLPPAFCPITGLPGETRRGCKPSHLYHWTMKALQTHAWGQCVAACFICVDRMSALWIFLTLLGTTKQ